MHVQGFDIVLLFPPSFCFHDLEQQRTTKTAIIKIRIILFNKINGLFLFFILRHIQVFVLNVDHSCVVWKI